MKTAIFVSLIAFIFILNGCGTVMVNIKEYPANRTEEQRQLDNLECHNVSKVNGPAFYGVGVLIIRQLSKERFITCMENKGYVMEK